MMNAIESFEEMKLKIRNRKKRHASSRFVKTMPLLHRPGVPIKKI